MGQLCGSNMLTIRVCGVRRVSGVECEPVPFWLRHKLWGTAGGGEPGWGAAGLQGHGAAQQDGTHAGNRELAGYTLYNNRVLTGSGKNVLGAEKCNIVRELALGIHLEKLRSNTHFILVTLTLTEMLDLVPTTPAFAFFLGIIFDTGTINYLCLIWLFLWLFLYLFCSFNSVLLLKIKYNLKK